MYIRYGACNTDGSTIPALLDFHECTTKAISTNGIVLFVCVCVCSTVYALCLLIRGSMHAGASLI